MENKEIKELDYWRKNAEEDYTQVPISVLRYISELEEQPKKEPCKTVGIECKYCDCWEKFNKEAEENLKNKGTVDFIKEVENCKKIIEKSKQVSVCRWSYDNVYIVYNTNCGKMFFLEDGVAENNYKFCPNCGGEIKTKKD